MSDNFYSSGAVTVVWAKAGRDAWTLRGTVGGVAPVAALELYAAAPADRRTTFTGSGLPFPCESFGPGQGPTLVRLEPGGAFTATVLEPNAWQDEAGVIHGPEVRLTITRTGGAREVHHVPLPGSARIPFRSLTYLEVMDPVSLNDDIARHDARSQEEVLRSRAYPQRG